MSDEHKQQVSLNVNNKDYQISTDPRRLLADVLREDLGLTGTNLSCELGVCGICTVLMNGKLTRSCLTLAVQADGASIETVESLAEGGQLHPIQQAFHEHHALQCGFCTPGFLVTLHGLFKEHPDATDQQIDDALDGVLCRCTGYQNITAAARTARQMLKQQQLDGEFDGPRN